MPFRCGVGPAPNWWSTQPNTSHPETPQPADPRTTHLLQPSRPKPRYRTWLSAAFHSLFKVQHAASCTGSAGAPPPCTADNVATSTSTTPLPTIGTCRPNTHVLTCTHTYQHTHTNTFITSSSDIGTKAYAHTFFHDHHRQATPFTTRSLTNRYILKCILE